MATGNESAVITTSLEQRGDPKLPVWEHLITWTYDTDDEGAETQAININGVLLKIVFDIPLTTRGGTTSQLLIKDNSDNTIFDSGELAENATHTFNLFEPLSGEIDVIYEPSATSQSTIENPTVLLRGI